MSRVQPLASLQVLAMIPAGYELCAPDYSRCYRSGPEIVSITVYTKMKEKMLGNEQKSHSP